jgi:lipoprotein-anchoring transpeptidase ErfK/SrfK
MFIFMIARFLRAVSAAAILTFFAAAAFAAGPAPVPTPAFVYSPVPAPTPTVDPRWRPAPGTAAYDPNAPPPQPSAAAQASATNAASRAALDGHKTDHVRVAVTPGERAYELTHDLSYLDPLSWNVTAWKSRHQLTVYYKGHEYRTYHAVFGRNRLNGTKLWEGDRRTPEGVYTIIEKHPSLRWEWFLGLNYPNDVDHYRYEQLRDAEEVPEEGGRDIGEGGHIGIHGTDNPILNSGNIDWTTGCISVNNLDIDELSRILPVGTVVIINP